MIKQNRQGGRKKFINRLIVIGVLLLLVPLGASAAEDSNHAPLITSEPTTAVVAGQPYRYVITATDRDDDTVTYRLTASPTGLELEDSTVSWQPTTVGTYNVVLEASDQAGGYDNQAWQITVRPAAVSSLVIAPNDRPTLVNIGDHQQFTVSASDQYGNERSDASISWTTDEKFGSINQDGLFLASKAGTGFVAATSGEAKSSVGVIVKDIRGTLVNATNTNQTNTNQPEAAATTKPQTKNTNESQEVIKADNNANVAGATDQAPAKQTTSTTCTNPSTWLLILALVIYAIVLIVYYRFEKKHPSPAWWIFPLLLTVIGLIIDYRYICTQTYLWWPWMLVGLGAVITLFYKRRRRSDLSSSQTELPF